jgi:hypothetical protein
MPAVILPRISPNWSPRWCPSPGRSGGPLIGIDHETVMFTEPTATGFGERAVKAAA